MFCDIRLSLIKFHFQFQFQGLLQDRLSLSIFYVDLQTLAVIYYKFIVHGCC